MEALGKSIKYLFLGVLVVLLCLRPAHKLGTADGLFFALAKQGANKSGVNR